MRTLFKVAIIIPVILLSIDYYMSPYKEYKPTELGISQQQIVFDKLLNDGSGRTGSG